jgi:hypothetical protein
MLVLVLVAEVYLLLCHAWDHAKNMCRAMAQA